MDIETFLDIVSEMNPEALYPTNMKRAIIGMVEQFGASPRILLDKAKCIDILMEDGMSQEEALEYFDFNVIGAHVGENPCFAVLLKDMERGL